jgi:tetratricopeptide (TPR) repeat protein
MKKLILAFIFCTIAAGAAFAQNNMQAMNFLTVTSLLDYGQKLYDRGDYDEACAVFNHVLAYDSKQPQALQYLKNMGRAPAVSASPVLPPQVSEPIPQPPKTVDTSDARALKAAIAAEKQTIRTLQDQIMRMRDENMDSQSSEEKEN